VIDLSLLPIGAYEPRWFMKHHHMNPQDAVMAHLDLKSQFSVAIHFGTFQLTDEAINEPVEELQRQLKNHSLNESQFVALKNGESIRFFKKGE